MKYELSYHEEYHYFNISLSGKPDLNVYDEAIIEMMERASNFDEINIIWDVTQLEFDSISMNFMRKINEHRSKFHGKRGKDSRMAIVVDDQFAFALSRQYKAISSIQFNQNLKICKSYNEAIHYISEKISV
jgi:hypothetical protein